MKFAWWCRDDDKYPPNWWTPGFRSSHWGLATQFGERYWLSHVWWLHKETVVSLWFWWATTDKKFQKQTKKNSLNISFGRKEKGFCIVFFFSSRLPKIKLPNISCFSYRRKKKKSDTVPESSIIIGRERERETTRLTGLPSLVRWCPLSYYSILSCGKKTTRLTPSSPPVDDDDNNNKL